MTAITNAAPKAATPADYAPKPAEKNDNSGFLALLNIGSVNADTPAPQAAPEVPRANAPRSPSKPQESSSSATDTPLPKLLQSAERPDPQAPRSPQPSDTTHRDEPKTDQTQTARENAPATAPKKAASEDHTDENPATPVKEKAAQDSDTQTATDAEDIADKQKKIREKLDNQLSGIEQLLQALIAALTKATPTPEKQFSLTAAASNNSDASAATQPLADSTPVVLVAQPTTLADLIPLADLLAGASIFNAASAQTSKQTGMEPALTPAASTSSTTSITLPSDVGAQNDLELLKDIQSLLQQLRDNLKAVDTTPTTSTASAESTESGTPNTASQQPANATPATSTPTAQTQQAVPLAQLQILVENAQQDVASLSERITLPHNESATVTFTSASLQTQEDTALPVSTLPATTDLKQPQNILGFIKDSISQIRAQLQNLRNDNETVYAQAKTTLQQQFDITLRQNQPLAPTATAIATNIAATPEITAQAATVSAPASAPAQQPAIQAAPPITITFSPIALENSSSDTQSQQQNTPQQQTAATPVSAGQASSNMETSRTEAPSFARAVIRTQQTPLADQVALQVKNAVSDGTSKIRIQLDPADLGKMDIKLSVDDNGKTGMTILVDNKNTLELLQRDASSLTRALNEAGLSADNSSLSFNLRGGQQQNQQNNQQANHTYQKAQPAEEEMPIHNIINRSYVVNLADGLDIQI